jgi:hypothetical protein
VPADDALIIDLEKDLIGGAVAEVRRTFRVGQPARVKSPYRDLSRADVTFPIRWLATNRESFADPPAPALPVMLPRGGGYCIQFDLAEDDLGIAIACDGPVAGLYETGDEVTPQFPQGHDYGCAVFYPCGRVSSSETPTTPPNPAGTMLLGAEDNSASITLRRTGGPSPDELGSIVATVAGPTASILLGGDMASEAVAVASVVQANLDALNSAIQSWVPVPNDGGASLKPVIQAWASALQSMADLIVMVKGPTP